MKLIEFKGDISTPGNANNSNIDPNIEIIEVIDSKTKEKVKVKILKDPSNYLNPILCNLTDEILYDNELDSRNVPLLNKIEFYPNLPEDIYIPLKYIERCNNKFLTFSKEYFINKEGRYIINYNSKFRQNSTNRKNKDYERIGINVIGNKTKNISLQRAVSSTFLINPKPELYNNVNHINHIISNNNLSNLEWVTPARNSDKESGCCNNISDEKLMEYIAMDKDGNEIFKINKNNYIHNGIEYNVLAITSIISNRDNKYYKGYYWKKSRLSKKEKSLIKIGCTGNIKDYTWYSHPLYPNVSVCKEGFVKSNGKILCSINKQNYVYATVGKGHGKQYRVNRLIMEFLIGRYLKDKELVDHINTNTLDNSFENLRIVDYVGNNRNKNTLFKISTLIVVADLFGDFLYCGFSKDCGKFMKIETNDDRGYRVDNLKNVNITNNKYICITPRDSDLLKEKMKSVFYMFKDNKPIDASKTLKLLSEKYKLSINELQNSLHKGKIISGGFTIKKGEDAVNDIISFKHGTASLFTPDLDKFKEEQNKIDYSKYEKYLEKELEIEYSTNQKPVKEFDLFGNYLKTYKSTTSTNKRNMVNCLIGESLSSYNSLWCYLEDTSKINEDLKYIFYKIDKDGNFVKASIKSMRTLFDVEINKEYNYENDKKYQKAKKYLNTGMLAPDGFYYQQGIDFIEPDPNNIDLIPKRPILRWISKSKRDKNENNKE